MSDEKQENRGVKRKRTYDKPAPQKTKNWRYTVHKGHTEMCTEELWKKWIEEKWTMYGDEIDYIMGAWEKGAETGVLHIQGWIQFSIRKKLVR